MPLSQSRRQNNRSNTSRPSLLPHQRFPKQIRNELRMTCALRGYSAMRVGDGKTLLKQYEYLNRFYHGNGSKAPSQIKMLAEGMSPYSDLYSSKKTTIVTNKKKGPTSREVSTLYLKENLSRETNRLYYVGDPITHRDLEKKIDLVLH